MESRGGCSWSGNPGMRKEYWKQCRRCEKCEVRKVTGAEPEEGCKRPVLFVYFGIGVGQLNGGEGIGTAVEGCQQRRIYIKLCTVLRVIYILK